MENVVHPMTVRLQVVQKENAVVQADAKLILVQEQTVVKVASVAMVSVSSLVQK